jgi:hypothetical protein
VTVLLSAVAFTFIVAELAEPVEIVTPLGTDHELKA